MENITLRFRRVRGEEVLAIVNVNFTNNFWRWKLLVVCAGKQLTTKWEILGKSIVTWIIFFAFSFSFKTTPTECRYVYKSPGGSVDLWITKSKLATREELSDRRRWKTRSYFPTDSKARKAAGVGGAEHSFVEICDSLCYIPTMKDRSNYWKTASHFDVPTISDIC